MTTVLTIMKSTIMVHPSENLPDVRIELLKHSTTLAYCMGGYKHSESFSASITDLTTMETECSDKTGVYNWAALRYAVLKTRMRSQGYEVKG